MRSRFALRLAPLFALAGCASMITGGPLVTDPNGPIGEIAVANNSRQRIDVVLISRCSASTYGLNRMGRGESIPSGQTKRFPVTPGCYDVAAGVVGYGEVRQRFPTVAANGVVTLNVGGGN